MQIPETDALIHNMLSKHRGFAIGEQHGQAASIEFMIRHMDQFAHSGVKFIGTEIFENYEHQKLLDHFFETGEIKPELEEQIKSRDMIMAIRLDDTALSFDDAVSLFRRWSDKQITDPEQVQHINHLETVIQHYTYSLRHLLHEARDHGIRVVGINYYECNPLELGPKSTSQRLWEMNEFASQEFERRAADGKMILHCGRSHLRAEGNNIPGVCDIVKIPGITVHNSISLTPSIRSGDLADDYIIEGCPERLEPSVQVTPSASHGKAAFAPQTPPEPRKG